MKSEHWLGALCGVVVLSAVAVIVAIVTSRPPEKRELPPARFAQLANSLEIHLDKDTGKFEKWFDNITTMGYSKMRVMAVVYGHGVANEEAKVELRVGLPMKAGGMSAFSRVATDKRVSREFQNPPVKAFVEAPIYGPAMSIGVSGEMKAVPKVSLTLQVYLVR